MTQEILSSPAWRGIFDTESPFSENRTDTPLEHALHQPDTSTAQALGQLGIQKSVQENYDDHEADDGNTVYRGLE